MNFDSNISRKVNAILKYNSKVYIALIFLLIFVILGNYLLNFYTTKARDEDYLIINISGRQRMLTQRLNSLVNLSESVRVNLSINTTEEIKKNIIELKSGLEVLEASRFVKDNVELNKIYFGIGGVHELTHLFINKMSDIELEKSDAKTQEVKQAEIFLIAYDTLLPLLDKVTFLKQKISEEGFETQKKINLFALLFSIFIVIFEIIFIFLPLIKNLRISVNQLDRLYKASLAQARMVTLGESMAYVGHELKNTLAI